MQPYCVVGLTFRNLAEATFNGYPQACSAPGVCDYGDRDGEVMTYIPTTGGKGLSEFELGGALRGVVRSAGMCVQGRELDDRQRLRHLIPVPRIPIFHHIRCDRRCGQHCHAIGIRTGPV